MKKLKEMMLVIVKLYSNFIKQIKIHINKYQIKTNYMKVRVLNIYKQNRAINQFELLLIIEAIIIEAIDY